MAHQYQPLKWALVLALFATSTMSLARDISPEQRAASEARKAYNRVKNNYQDLNQHITHQEKRVADEQAKLNALKAEYADTQKVVEVRKQDLDRKVEQLNAVWEQRTR